MKITEGYMPYLGYTTYYRIVGDLSSSKTPIILLHGGPGSTHNYFELLDCLAEDERAVISYDQLGCGNSYVDGRPDLWNIDVWEEELQSLIRYLGIKRYHLLGQSWGGMLTLHHVIFHDRANVASAILSSTLSDSQLWGREQHRMIRLMSKAQQDAIAKAEETGDYTSSDYLSANEIYMQLHCAGPFDETSPECLTRAKRSGSESYLVGWGPNEYTPTGTLASFNVTDQLHTIQAPCLIFSGTDDLCTPLVAKTMFDRIPDATWHLLENARHMCFADQTEQYCKILSDWLNAHD